MLNPQETVGQVALREACVPPPPRIAPKDLARRMRVTRAAVSSWLRGVSRPSDVQRKKLARILGIAEEAWDQVVDTSQKAA